MDVTLAPVVFAESIERALLQATTHQPALIILDSQLPSDRPTELISELRARMSSPRKVLLLIGRLTSRQAPQLRTEYGVDRVLGAPFNLTQLAGDVEALLDLRRAPSPRKQKT